MAKVKGIQKEKPQKKLLIFLASNATFEAFCPTGPLWLEAWSKGSAYGSHAKSVKLNLKLSSTQIDLQATLITTT